MIYAINRRRLITIPEPVDFRALLAQIRAAGYGPSDLAFVLNVPRGTIWRWEQGSIPLHHHGELIIAFAEEISQTAATAAHERSEEVHDSAA